MSTEETVTCPYNSSHRIIKSRYQMHLVRCKRNYPYDHLKMCQFDSTHLIAPSEYDKHLEICPMRKEVENLVYRRDHETYEPPFRRDTLQRGTSEYIHKEEDWEAELVNKSYNPEEKCLKSNVLRAPKNMTKSQRQIFRLEERQRLNNLPNKTNKTEKTEKEKSGKSLRCGQRLNCDNFLGFFFPLRCIFHPSRAVDLIAYVELGSPTKLNSLRRPVSTTLGLDQSPSKLKPMGRGRGLLNRHNFS